jgi:predicted ferric reductase
LIPGRIGVTTFILAALLLQEQCSKYHLYYAIPSSQDIAFRQLIDGLGKNVTILDGSKGQRLQISKKKKKKLEKPTAAPTFTVVDLRSSWVG